MCPDSSLSPAYYFFKIASSTGPVFLVGKGKSFAAKVYTGISEFLQNAFDLSTAQIWSHMKLRCTAAVSETVEKPEAFVYNPRDMNLRSSRLSLEKLHISVTELETQMILAEGGRLRSEGGWQDKTMTANQA